MATREHSFQFQVVEYLRLRKFIVIDCDIMDGLKYAQPKYRYPFIMHHRKMGYVKGQPDLIIMKKGKVWCLELKSDKGRQTKEQKDFQQLCIENQIPYLVIKSLEDVINIEKEI